ncbi:MAG: OmpA family protein, partial [Polyangiales bacterium]
LTGGYGAPDRRGYLSVEWTPVPEKQAPPPPDRDQDGILDVDDACPETPGVPTDDPATNGCPPPPPPPDRDHDGIIDADDACPDEPGKPSEDPKQHGCPPPPPDRDHDGILDADDACPDEPGKPNEDPKQHGCPPPLDRDKDGIVDAEDACPGVPGSANIDRKRNGCPRAYVSESSSQINVLDQVKFKTNSAEILPGRDSEDVLEAVLSVMNDHPEITKMQVEGHTDSTGAAEHNRKLSKNRAQSVVTWLVKHGIDTKRLSAAGYGPDKPIDSNDTEEGRRNNRRVEFHIDTGAYTPPAP